jgi:hypothetical protein
MLLRTVTPVNSIAAAEYTEPAFPKEPSRKGEPMPTRMVMVTVLATIVVALAGCNAQGRPDAPTNLLGQVVDPVYGTPVLGTPPINGGRD